MTRMRMTWWDQRLQQGDGRWKETFQNIVQVAVLFYAISIAERHCKTLYTEAHRTYHMVRATRSWLTSSFG